MYVYNIQTAVYIIYTSKTYEQLCISYIRP